MFTIPLKPEAEEVLMDLKPLLDGIYDRAGFQFRIDYDAALKPALSNKNQAWLVTRRATE